jgi:ubiquinone/menaquinone biosynthesis C-methylase UbiE
MEFMRVAREKNIQWADATRRIPLPDNSAEVLYSSHMIEHLAEQQARTFLREARRVLTRGGTIRIAVPDIRKLAVAYLENQDADKFVESTLLATDSADTLGARLKFLLIGPRNHRWMYDGRSMTNLLSSEGFSEAVVLNPGETGIKDPGALDLWERADESVYIEAFKL